MTKKARHLTGSEEELMELFWVKDEPLTSVEILDIAVDHTWNDSYLHIMLRSLLKKDMIKVCGTVQYGCQYARQFIPTITKEEYLAKLIISKGFKKSSVAEVAVALVKEEGETDENHLIAQLEKIIEELKERKPKEK